MSTQVPVPAPQVVPALTVTAGAAEPGMQKLRFQRSFRIGRAEGCDVRIINEYVSRYQAEVTFEQGTWKIRDLGSSNGIFLSEQRVQEVLIGGPTTVRMGVYGPDVSFDVEWPAGPVAAPSMAASTAVYARHYFEEALKGQPADEHTEKIRRAFRQVQKKQRRKQFAIIGSLLIVLLAVAGYAAYQYRQISQQTATAKDLFYAMKALEVELATFENLVRDSNNRQGADQLRNYRNRKQEMEKTYNRFLTNLRVYDPRMTETQRLILRMARVFGECELDMPPGFADEVQNYIKKWQSSSKLVNALNLTQTKGYTQEITKALLAQNLPPQFLYMALQESSFDPFISGPPTRKGFAKGMWQFIPETAVKYGLRIGPLADFPRPDLMDDRHDWHKATAAASRYLKDLYATDAQASGLLVMACYNWGEDSVIPLIQSMPANPRERNFWRLLTDHRKQVPGQTYDYVFYIFSAAVIGENPRLFGFQFDNPLAHADAR